MYRNSPGGYSGHGQGGSNSLMNRSFEVQKQEELLQKKKRDIEERQRSGGGVSDPSKKLGEIAAKHNLDCLVTVKPSKVPKVEEKKNVFSNDGSFLEMFKKRQMEAKSEVKGEDFPKPSVAQCMSIPPPSILLSHPPPPIIHSSPSPSEIAPSVSRQMDPRQLEFKRALEHARSIASHMRSNTPSASVHKQPPLLNRSSNDADVKDEPENSSFATSNSGGGGGGASDSSAGGGVGGASSGLSSLAMQLASLVAVNGDVVEEMAREKDSNAKELTFLHDKMCEEYMIYRMKVDELKSGFEEDQVKSDYLHASTKQEEDKDEKKHQSIEHGGSDQPPKKTSRFGPKIGRGDDGKPLIGPPGVAENLPISGVSLPLTQHSKSSSSDGRPKEVVQYAMKVYGHTDLEPHQWKQCEDQLKMSFVYNEMKQKQLQLEKLEAQGKHKHAYDSDEEIDEVEGTWEHQTRRREMEKTREKSLKLTKEGWGKHHISHFLPPQELKKFLAKYKAVQTGEKYDDSDYVDNKIQSSNPGFKLLQKMGWSDGTGLGSSQQGIVDPVNASKSSEMGLGVSVPHNLEKEDDEFDAYRKRMMISYRFRPNPLNNPRRAYY